MYPPKLVGLNANRKLVFGTQPGVNVSLDSNVSGNQQTTLAMKNATNNQTAYNYKGVYSGTTQYFKGENVLYGQTFWLALQNALGQTPATGSASWQAIASYNAFQGAWSSTTIYVVGDEVTSGGNFWVALAANTNSLPSTSNANWQIAGPVSLANVADDPLGTWRKVSGVGTGNLVGFKSLVGDTSGDNTTSLVDTNTKSFLHATMSTPTKTTVASAPDTNGSYLQHGVVFQPHIHANQIGWGHFIGDTSGNYTGNLVDGLNLRFLHGAMSGPTQGTINPNVDTFGSYLGHGTVFQPHISARQIGFGHFKGDTSGNYSTSFVDGANLRFLHGAMSGPTQNTIATTAGGDGSYLNPGQVFNRHLNQATQSGLADDATYLRWKATQQTAMSRPSQGHINDPTFTSVSDFWSNVGTASSGVFTLPAMTANQGFGPAARNLDGRGNINQIAVQPGDIVVLQLTCNTAATGTVATSLTGLFVNSAGSDLGVYPFVTAGAASTTPYVGAPVSAPANAVGLWIYFQGNSGVSGGNNASVSNPVVRINHETVIDTNAKKAFVDFTNNVSGGHIGKVLTNIADDATYTKTLASVQTGNVPDLSKGILNKTANYITYTAGGTVDSLRPAQAGADISPKGLSNIAPQPAPTAVGSIANGVVTGWYVNSSNDLQSFMYANNANAPVLGYFQIAADGTAWPYAALGVNGKAIDFQGGGGNTIYAQADLNFDTSGSSLTIYAYVTHADGTKTTYQIAQSTVVNAWTHVQGSVTLPNDCVSFQIWIYGGTALTNQLFYFSNVVVGEASRGVSTPNGTKAYVDFTNNVSGGHVGKTQSNIADDSNAKMLRFGTLASRPAAGTAGRIYHASDAGTNGITYRDTGSAWVGMAVGHLADINGTLDNTSDGSSRFAVAAVDPNKKALIDYSQPGHANANLQYFGGIQSGYCYDGQAITFNPTYSSIPLVFFPANGMTYSSGVGSAASQSLAFTASSLTTSGFTASLKLVTGGTLTARSDNFSAVVAGSEYNATLTNAPAYNNQYTVNWTLSLGSSSAGTVEIRETNSTGTLLSSHNYLNGQNGAKATGVTWSGATGTSVIDISLTVTQGTGTISASTVTFTSGTAPSTNSAVPSTAPILWIALPQT